MPRYQVTITRTETSEAVVWVTADNPTDAEEMAQQEEPDYDYLDGDEEYDVNLIDPKHEADPISLNGRSVCKVCEGPVKWSGKQLKTKTIPGPWVHVKECP